MRIGIAGAAGYTAGELIRILIGHPGAELRYIQSESHQGLPVYKVHQDLLYSRLVFSDIDFSDIDVLFLCMGHGVSGKFLNVHPIPANVKIIDLGNDFRLEKESNGFIYGLPELSREEIRKGRDVSLQLSSWDLFRWLRSGAYRKRLLLWGLPDRPVPAKSRQQILISVIVVIISPIIRFSPTSIWMKSGRLW